MTQEQYNELRCIAICLSIMPAANEYSDRDVLKRIALTQDELQKFIDDNKPFEIEVGKEYVARFDLITWQANCSRLPMIINKGEILKVYNIVDLSVYFMFDENNKSSMTFDQFKASFEPMEEES